jgi:uroporphyrinogen decarboxylase
MFHLYAIGPAKRIVDTLRSQHPDIPVIGFPRGAGGLYPEYASAVGIACVALDQQVPLKWAREVMPNVALQGNLDPLLMVLGGVPLRDQARRIVDAMRGHPHVFNLGHGITPDANPSHVDQLLTAIRS